MSILGVEINVEFRIRAITRYWNHGEAKKKTYAHALSEIIIYAKDKFSRYQNIMHNKKM